MAIWIPQPKVGDSMLALTEVTFDQGSTQQTEDSVRHFSDWVCHSPPSQLHEPQLIPVIPPASPHWLLGTTLCFLWLKRVLNFSSTKHHPEEGIKHRLNE